MALLHIILDTSPLAWRRRGAGELRPFEEVVDAVAAFGKAYLLLNRENDVRVLAAQAPNPGVILDDCELYSSTRHGAKEHFHEVLLARAAVLVAKNDRASATATASGPEAPTSPPSTASGPFQTNSPPATAPASQGGGLPAAFSRALCHVHRLRADAQGVLGASVGTTPSQQHNSAAAKKPARVLVLQADHDRDSLYNQAMNCIFAAHAMDVVVDACMLRPGLTSRFMQQATDRTGGAYLEAAAAAAPPSKARTNATAAVVPQPALLTELVLAFLPSPAERHVWLRAPQATLVDLSATCFCHGTTVDGTAFVCSVCLAVFCEPAPVCPTCKSDVSKGGGEGTQRPSKRQRANE